MLLMIVRNAARCCRNREARILVLLLGKLNASFDFADRVEILGYTVAVVRTQIALQPPHLSGDRVQDAALLLNALQPFLSCRAVAEEVIEDDARIDFHRQWDCRGSPGNRVHVRTTEAYVARSDKSAVVFGGKFEGWQGSFL